MKQPIIQFEQFGFQYRAQSKPTLYDINLTISKGEKVLIAGPSGCGKSTLVHCINGLIPFAYKGEMTGSVRLLDKETGKLSIFDISKHVGTVLQDSDAQFVGLTVAEDIAFALENDCIQEPMLHDRVAEVARMVNVQDLLESAPEDLSGGQKQRVSMAGVLVEDAELLLFDEPLANLDPATGKRAIELIDEMQQQTGAAVVIIEHRLEDVLHRNVDRIVLMGEGRILFNGTPDELLCTELLSENGIREPLYVTALKYAGVQLTPQMQPASLETLTLCEADRQKVRDWFLQNPEEVREPAAEPLLQVEDLSFAYANGREILKHISMQVNRGEMLAVVGTNGAGKSTFSKVICGFETTDKGSLRFKGEDLNPYSIKERADRIGYVMQNPNQMISKVMIMEEVGLGLKSRGASQQEIEEKCETALKTCGLWPFRKWPISALSFGQKKRVTIASILTLDPDMIILDEPTAGQDYRHYTEIMEFLKELNRRGITILMITHDMHLMLEYADRAVVFSDGQIIADDTGARILTDERIIEAASLKETSLYPLAVRCGIADASSFVQRFIDFERSEVRHGKSI